MDALTVARACVSAFDTADWEALRRLYHPGARNVAVAAGSRALTAQETLRAMKEAHTDAMYHPALHEIEAIDENAAIATGSVSYSLPGGGSAAEPRCWLFTVKDGLLYRTVAFANGEEARTAYARLGVDLGIQSAD